MATFKKFEDIVIWQKGRELVKLVYELTRKRDFSRDFGLRDQIQRAAVSVPSNIAEGFERDGNKEFVKHLYIAKGSAGEVQSQLYNARDLGYITEDEFNAVYEFACGISSGIVGLIRALSGVPRSGRRYDSP